MEKPQSTINVRHSRESGNPENPKAPPGFPRIKYGAGLVKPGMTDRPAFLFMTDLDYHYVSNDPIKNYQAKRSFVFFAKIRVNSWQKYS